MNKENSFTNKIHKSYDIDNYDIDKNFSFDKDKIFFEDSNTIIYDIGNGLGFKIERSLFDKTRQSYNIEKMVSELALRQGKIKLTDLPVGVVSCKKNCIGQVIKLYKDYVPLCEIANNNNIEMLYNKVLNIIDELLDNGILYLDIHENNFLVNDDLDVKLIDFESSSVIFDRISANDKIECYKKVKDMFKKLEIKRIK